jgi:F-type H+-transporting ATPase subunit b
VNINLTLIGQSLSFIFFVLFCMKFVWPAITNAMAERQKLIADGLEAADRAGRDRELAQEEALAKLHKAKIEASVIIEQANKRASQIVDESKEQARVEADRIKVSAQAEVAKEVTRAKEELRAQVGALALAGAEKILAATVDAQAHQVMLNKLAAEL